MFDIVTKIAESNGKTNPKLRGLRIKDGAAMATNMVNTVKVEGLPTNDIDCYVDASGLSAAWDSMKKPTISLNGEILTFKEGRFKIDLQLLNKEEFGLDPDKQPDGEPVAPGNFCDAVRRIAPFLQVSTGSVPNAYIVGDYLYATNGEFLVRSKLTVKWPTLPPKEDGSATAPLTVSQGTAEILTKIKEDPHELLVSHEALTVTYPHAWVESARFGGQLPADFERLFEDTSTDADGNAINIAPLEDEIALSLKYMTDAAEKDDLLNFSPMGISLMQQGKISWNVACPMPMFRIKATAFKTMLKHAKDFNFENPKKVIFKGDEIEGVWSKLVFTKSSEDMVEAEKEPATV